MLERILPPPAVVVSSEGDREVELFPEEEEALGRAVEKRRREFVTARACAREALSRLGLPAQPIPVGARGAPVWPAGIVGSITHCAGYRGCAVARASELLTLGIDAEPDEPLPPGVLGDIALAEEQDWIEEARAAEPGRSWDRLLFSIKESVYKAWFPLTGSWLGFEDAAVSIDRTTGTFSARLLVPGPTLGSGVLEGFVGRWGAAGGLLLSAIAVPAL
ncbi:MAG TPA: 4'-phosphopantetheinyl transferase superfamily protein [Solirubrobacterales bacterium]|nr:4'-phosphopantetheinyl transferase superfamily protein [Solirubrobacterales bacterium]